MIKCSVICEHVIFHSVHGRSHVVVRGLWEAQFNEIHDHWSTVTWHECWRSVHIVETASVEKHGRSRQKVGIMTLQLQFLAIFFYSKVPLKKICCFYFWRYKYTSSGSCRQFIELLFFRTLSPQIIRPPTNAHEIIRSQVARLQERMDSVNHDLVTCIKSHSDVTEALVNGGAGEWLLFL